MVIMKSHTRTISLFVFILSVLAASVLHIHAETPRLVVIISINGLNANEIEAYAPCLEKNGLIKLTSSGWYTNLAQYKYIAPDVTTHYASLLTGSTPRYHGIVSNRFFSLIDNDIVSCIDDARFSGINSTLSVSPRLLQATTLTDQVKLCYPESKVYSIALTAENAIMLGGHLADAAIWLDESTGKLATTTFYNNGLPIWAERINNDSTIEQMYNNAWFAAKTLKEYQFAPTYQYYGEAQPAFQKFKSTDSMRETIRKFRHTPMVNNLIKELAVRAIRDEQLGTDNAPDILCVEFNAATNNNISQLCAEKEDLLIRLDEDIERLLETIEVSVGIENSIIVFTSPIINKLKIQDNAKSRINEGVFKSDRAMALLNAYLMAIYGQGRWIAGYYNQNIYLNKSLIEDNQINTNEILDRAAQFINEFSGVHSAIPSYQIRTAASIPYDEMSRMRNSHYKNRSGDIIITLLPGWTEERDNKQYEQICTYVTPLLPVAILTPNGKGGDVLIDIEDVCPTICNLLKISIPNACIGKTLNLH